MVLENSGSENRKSITTYKIMKPTNPIKYHGFIGFTGLIDLKSKLIKSGDVSKHIKCFDALSTNYRSQVYKTCEIYTNGSPEKLKSINSYEIYKTL